jgi:hypothetical protein
LALAPDKSAAVGSSDADASEGDHVDENLLQDLLWRLMSIRGTQFMQLGIWMSRFASVSARATTLVKSIRWVFMAPARFAARPRPVSMGYILRGLKRGNLFLELFSPAFEAPQQAAGLDRVRARSSDENLEPSQMNQGW